MTEIEAAHGLSTLYIKLKYQAGAEGEARETPRKKFTPLILIHQQVNFRRTQVSSPGSIFK